MCTYDIYIYIEVVYIKLKICIILLGVNRAIYEVYCIHQSHGNEAQGWVWGRATFDGARVLTRRLEKPPQLGANPWNAMANTRINRAYLRKTKIPADFFWQSTHGAGCQVWISWSSQEVLSRTYLQWKFSWRSSLRRWILSTLSRRKSQDKNLIWKSDLGWGQACLAFYSTIAFPNYAPENCRSLQIPHQPARLCRWFFFSQGYASSLEGRYIFSSCLDILFHMIPLMKFAQFYSYLTPCSG